MRGPIQATPYVRLIRRLFKGRGSLQAIADRIEVLCPEETTTMQPAVFLPGQLDKVADFKSLDPLAQSSKAAQIAAATSTTFTHPATIAYHIKNAVLFDGSIYMGHFKYPIVADKSLVASRTHGCCHFGTRALASTLLGTKYFGHWLADDCTKYVLAQEVARPLCVRMSPYSHKPRYEEYFRQDWTPTDRACVDNLIVFQDFSQNSLKRNRYSQLRNRIKACHPRNLQDSYVYLRRSQSGERRLIHNEHQIVDTLMQRGFVLVDSSDDLDRVIKALVDAKIVVSIEGSHIAHCIYSCPEISGVLVLQPPDRFSAIHRDWAECLGMRFGFVVGSGRTGEYHFSISEILRTIDLMVDEIER